MSQAKKPPIPIRPAMPATQPPRPVMIGSKTLAPLAPKPPKAIHTVVTLPPTSIVASFPRAVFVGNKKVLLSVPGQSQRPQSVIVPTGLNTAGGTSPRITIMKQNTLAAAAKTVEKPTNIQITMPAVENQPSPQITATAASTSTKVVLQPRANNLQTQTNSVAALMENSQVVTINPTDHTLPNVPCAIYTVKGRCDERTEADAEELQTRLFNFLPPSAAMSMKPPKCNDDFTVLLDGEIVVVDGVTYVNNSGIDGITLVDCPRCELAVGLHVLASHLSEVHDVVTMDCLAPRCPEKLECHESGQFLEHLMQTHGAFLCPECRLLLYQHEVKSHLASNCKDKAGMEKRLLKPISLEETRGKKQKRKQCVHCCQEIATDHMLAHIRGEHRKRSLCLFCRRLVAVASQRHHHSRDHGGMGGCSTEKRCPVCGDDVSGLKEHLVDFHGMRPGEEVECVYQDFFKRARQRRMVVKLTKKRKRTSETRFWDE